MSSSVVIPSPEKLVDTLQRKFRAFDGPLTEQLVRHPGRWGLGQVPATNLPDATTSSVCGFCATGCSLNLHLKEGQAVNLTPDPEYPVNLGMACPKGWEALSPLESQDRLTTPRYRESRSEQFRDISWVEAAEIFCERMRKVGAQWSPESCAFLSTGQICSEEMALLGAFAKFEMGMIHGDGNTRQCMATAVTAYKESFGFDAPPYTYADFEESDVIVLVGSNLCIAHPIMWQRVLANRRSPEIVVIDPRKTETAMQASQHLALQPKSDLTLFYGLARELIRRGYVDREFVAAHTSEFDAFSEFVDAFPLEEVEKATAISSAELEKVVETIGRGERVSFWWTMGVNQGYEATRIAQSIINLALMTGNIGRPGTGANSITGQCNAMGSRLFSNTTNLLGGHDFTNPAHREKVASVLGIDPAQVPDQRSLAYDQILEGIDTGDIRGLWMIATNGGHSWCDRKQFLDRVSKLDFFVVQDLYGNTESAQHADLLLPAAGWGEKEGTFINSERRFGLVKKVRQAPGMALSDFSIFRLLAKAWGSGAWIDRWNQPEAVFHDLKEITRGQPCDITGMKDYAWLDRSGGCQWPVPESQVGQPEPQRRLFEDGQFFTPDRRAKFCFEPPAANPESTNEQFPFVLLTGRGTSAQWHTQTRTAKSGVLRRMYPKKCYLEMHPDDAACLKIENGDSVQIRSRRGEIVTTVWKTPTVGRGRVFLPMHYAETNRLTQDVVDPYSRQPNFKSCAVSVEKA